METAAALHHSHPEVWGIPFLEMLESWSKSRLSDPYTGVTGGLEGLSNWAGHGVGLIDRIQPAAEIVRDLTEHAVQVLRRGTAFIQE